MLASVIQERIDADLYVRLLNASAPVTNWKISSMPESGHRMAQPEIDTQAPWIIRYLPS